VRAHGSRFEGNGALEERPAAQEEGAREAQGFFGFAEEA
jgi:hypothetical protein